MARRLGISLSGYRYWERGERTPRGRWLLRLRELCPDPQTRLLFGGPTEPIIGESARPGAKPAATQPGGSWDDYKNGVIVAIEALREKAVSGDATAQKRLREIFTQLRQPARRPSGGARE
jgi:hypothetical protein